MIAPSRGAFLRTSTAVGASLTFALQLPIRARAAALDGVPAGASAGFTPNAFVRIDPDETVTITIGKSEMGQGVYLGLPTILGDELDAAPSRIRVEFAPADKRYIDTAYGDMVTGGSTSVAHSWMQLRQAGATARALLISAAAHQWTVDPASCTAHEGVVTHTASGRTATYGSLTAIAAQMPMPTDVPLKTPDKFTLIGKPRQRPDIPGKTNGSITYGIDVRIPGMLYAAIARSPVFGGSVKSFDASKAKKIWGVVDVVQVSNGVAVVAKNTWSAFQGKDALAIEWDNAGNEHLSTASLFKEAEHMAATAENEKVSLLKGDPDGAKGTVLEAFYRGPLLAHATMEPQNTTADVRDDSCEIWSPNQVQLRALAAASAGSGLPPDQIKIHTTFLGGGFGRRLESDYVREAAEVSKAIKKPVKVMWSREDDIQHDTYRPMSYNVVRGVVSDGELVALSHLVVSKSWLRTWAPPYMASGIDFLDLTEVQDAPYDIPNVRYSYIEHNHPVTAGSWRAPDANWNGFVTESFIDELAHAAGKDPLAFRMSLLGKSPRAAHVLSLAAEKGHWGTPTPHGIARGLAVTFWGGSYAAMVVEVSIKDKMPHVHRVVAVVDCGTVINPDIIVQQAQGATNFGLSAALTGKITIANGKVEQNNFYDYTVLRLADAPAIEVHIVPSTESPTGVGEICVPPIAPAVAQAVFALTGKRVRSLPFSDAF